MTAVSNSAVEETGTAPEFRRHSRLSHDAALALATVAYLVLLNVTYFILRDTNRWLYFASYFDFKAENTWIATGASLLIAPLLIAIIKRSKSDPFAFVIMPLSLVGGASGTIVLSYSDPSTAAIFALYYIVIPAFLLLLVPPGIEIRRLRFGAQGSGFLLSAGMAGVIIYLYIAIMHRNLLGLPSFSTVYDYRFAFDAAVGTFDRYALLFAKYVAAFCLASYAILYKKSYILFGPLFIFSLDFMLAGHKTSIFFALFIFIYYIAFSNFGVKYKPFYVPFFGSVVIFAALCIIFLSETWAPIMIALYDRIFHVSSGLFVRYVEFSESNYFFWGGSGFLGYIFDGVRENYQEIIGNIYFGQDVTANADIISDAYINYGSIGVICALLALRLMFSSRDVKFLDRHAEKIMILLAPPAFVIFSMGLQTALVSGGLLFTLMVLKLAVLPDKHQR